jgi:WD40 repeat protein
VAILPQINLVKLIAQESVEKYRNQDELLKYSPISELESEYKLNEQPKTYNITSLFNENEYKSAVFELVGIVVLGIPTIFLLVYLSIFLYFLVFYKCLCSTKYIEWGKSWSTSHIKRQYEIIHSNSKKTLNDSSENEQSDTSDYEDCVELSTNGKQSRRYANEQIKQIINEQNDEMTIETMFAFNTNTTSGEHQNAPLIKHHYPINLIACGASVCVTSDLNNQMIVWSIGNTTSTTTTNNPNYSKLIDLNSLNKANSNGDEPVAVWCMQVTPDDQYLLVGQSNGVLRAFHLANSTACVVSYEPDERTLDIVGLTHLIQFKLNENLQKCALLTRNLCHSNANSYFLLGARLDGYLEFFKLECTTCYLPPQSGNVSRGELSLVSRLRAHKSPITNIVTSNEYILSTSQENVLRISKVNAKSLLNNTQFELNALFTRDEHDNSPITAICIDMDNTVSATTGSMNGTICLWNLYTGECKFKLRKKCTRRNSICKLLLTQNVLISLNDEQEMCIWNGLDGNLMREFKFHARLGPKYPADGIERSSHQITHLSVFFKLFKSVRDIFASNNDDRISSNDQLFSVKQAPSTTMCLYSKNVLITGGCSCIYLWNIFKGELVKKLNIKPGSLDTTFCSFDSNVKKLSLSRLTHKNINKRISVIPQTHQQTLIIQTPFIYFKFRRI